MYLFLQKFPFTLIIFYVLNALKALRPSLYFTFRLSKHLTAIAIYSVSLLLSRFAIVVTLSHFLPLKAVFT